MFSNIGGKIKILAVVICVLGMFFALLSAIGSATVFSQNENPLIIIFTLIIGFLISWAGSFVLYGFGELIDRVSSIDEKISSSSTYDANECLSDNHEYRPIVENRYVICPTCGERVYFGETQCKNCPQTFNWENL
ncbi:MAG: hypothetical protein IJF54_06450 [Clostridia bacterium]|nr:hypothetical protein [Clostridia bacterium]